jgi:hypothetical protein
MNLSSPGPAACARACSLAALLVLSHALAGHLQDPELRTVRSPTGQFIVGVPGDFSAAPARSTNSAHVELSPHTLVVSCERIKSVLLRELGLGDYWFHPIRVLVNPYMAIDEPPIIAVRLYAEGWRYQVEVPRWIEPDKLVRGIVHVMFLELANRTAGTRSAEIPLWLIEGFSQHLMASTQVDLVVGHPSLTINGVQVRWQNRPPAVRQPLKNVREHLQEYAAFSFTRMAEVDPTELSEETWATFQACSHLLVSQLLTLPNARQQLCLMLSQLPHHLNWQIAFLNAFHPVFPRMLDVEKWWSVALVHFSGLDSANAWSVEVALAKIHDSLNPPILVNQQPDELPHRSNVPVQDIIDRFDYLRQRMLLQDVIRQLELLRTYTPPAVVPLLDDYRRTLVDYIQRRDRTGVARALPGSPPLNSDRLVREIVDHLDALDRRRAELAVNQAPASAALSN